MPVATTATILVATHVGMLVLGLLMGFAAQRMAHNEAQEGATVADTSDVDPRGEA